MQIDKRTEIELETLAEQPNYLESELIKLFDDQLIINETMSDGELRAAQDALLNSMCIDFHRLLDLEETQFEKQIECARLEEKGQTFSVEFQQLKSLTQQINKQKEKMFSRQKQLKDSIQQLIDSQEQEVETLEQYKELPYKELQRVDMQWHAQEIRLQYGNIWEEKVRLENVLQTIESTLTSKKNDIFQDKERLQKATTNYQNYQRLYLKVFGDKEIPDFQLKSTDNQKTKEKKHVTFAEKLENIRWFKEYEEQINECDTSNTIVNVDPINPEADQHIKNEVSSSDNLRNEPTQVSKKENTNAPLKVVSQIIDAASEKLSDLVPAMQFFKRLVVNNKEIYKVPDRPQTLQH